MSEIKIEQPSAEQRQELKIPNSCMDTNGWSVWTCEPSTFDWQYPSIEVAYVYEGKVKVKTSSGEVEIKKGDLVVFPKGLKCTWQVIKPIRKVYQMKA